MIPLWKIHYPDFLSPAGMTNYDDGETMWTYRRIVRRDDCPHLLTPENEKNRRAMEKKYGINSAFIRSMIYGEFVASEDADVIFESAHIELARRAMRGEFKAHPGDIRYSADISAGGDRMVFGAREGSNVVWLKGERYESELDCADAWVKRLRALEASPSQFTIDGGGIGKTVGNYMEARLDFWGINRFGYNNGPHEVIAFADRYTELHWILRELLELNAIVLPDCKELLVDMRDRRFVTMNGEKIKAEPKKAHRKRCNGRSPDFLDTLIYLLHDFPISEVRGKQEQLRKQVTQAADEDPTALELEAARNAQAESTGSFSGYRAVSPILELSKSRS